MSPTDSESGSGILQESLRGTISFVFMVTGIGRKWFGRGLLMGTEDWKFWEGTGRCRYIP